MWKIPAQYARLITLSMNIEPRRNVGIQRCRFMCTQPRRQQLSFLGGEAECPSSRLLQCNRLLDA